MATFSDAQITSLCRILGTNSNYLDGHLGAVESLISDTDKLAVLDDIDTYVANEDDNVIISAAEANFGANINPASKRALIKNRIAGLIHWEVQSSNRLVRG